MHYPTEAVIAAILTLCASLLLPGLFWFHGYTGLARGKANLALLASVLAGGLSIAYAFFNADFPHRRGSANNIFLTQAAAGASFVFLAAFVLRLWGRWIGENATPEERQPGQPGVRAWFSFSNVTVGMILILTLWYGFDIPLLLTAVVIGGALAAYPLLRMESPDTAAIPVLDDLSAEREKILTMLESGRLTADESAELLQALRQSPPASPRQAPLTGGQRLMLIGAAVVGLGFFLPWMVVNPGKEASRMMGRMQSSMSSSFGAEMDFAGGVGFSGGELKTPNISIGGGDIPKGLGWATLAFALTAALLPYLSTTLDAPTARTIRLLCLGIGGLILLYLLTQNLRFTGIGLVMAVIGYVLEGIGFLRENRSAAVSRIS